MQSPQYQQYEPSDMNSNYELIDKPIREQDSQTEDNEEPNTKQIEIDEKLGYQPDVPNSPTTQGLQHEEIPDLDLESNDMTAGIDKTSVSLSEKIGQDSKDERSDEILLDQHNDTNIKNSEGAEEQNTL